MFIRNSAKIILRQIKDDILQLLHYYNYYNSSSLTIMSLFKKVLRCRKRGGFHLKVGSVTEEKYPPTSKGTSRQLDGKSARTFKDLEF